jgi:hypothetical protein
VLAPAALRKLSPLAPMHLVPLGGFVQWVADYLYGRWHSKEDDFHAALNSLEAAVLRPFAASAVSANSWRTAALVGLLGAGR